MDTPLSDKSETGVKQAQRLGAAVDGEGGRIGSAKRFALLGAATAPITRQQFEIVAGHWARAFGFLRELMSAVVEVWATLRGRGTARRR